VVRAGSRTPTGPSKNAKARYFDPKLGRFLTQDSYLGQIDEPPSLHRYLYGWNRPTFFIDPTGHIVRQAIDQSINKSTNEASHWLIAGTKAFFKEAGYRTLDVISFGALHRQDELVDQNLAGEISDEEYWGKTGANVAISGAQAALTLGTGGAMGATRGAAMAWGAAGGIAGQGIADIGEIYGTETKTLEDVRITDYALGAAFGTLGGYAGYKARVPAPRNKPTPAGRTGVIAEQGQSLTPDTPSPARPAASATDVSVQPAVKPPAPSGPPKASSSGPGYIGPERQLPAGRPTTLSREQVARFKGKGYERGAAHNAHMAEWTGGTRDVPVETQLGKRVHDVRAPTGTATEMALEGKNYLRWRTVNGTPVKGSVPLSTEIRLQVYKDVLWVRAGRLTGTHRISQWDFPGAPPTPELARFLERWGIAYVH